MDNSTTEFIQQLEELCKTPETLAPLLTAIFTGLAEQEKMIKSLQKKETSTTTKVQPATTLPDISHINKLSAEIHNSFPTTFEYISNDELIDLAKDMHQLIEYLFDYIKDIYRLQQIYGTELASINNIPPDKIDPFIRQGYRELIDKIIKYGIAANISYWNIWDLITKQVKFKYNIDLKKMAADTLDNYAICAIKMGKFNELVAVVDEITL